MEEHEIFCIIHDKQQRITHVGVAGGRILPIEEIIRLMNDGHGFFTHQNNRKAIVVERTHPITGRKYLTTNADDINENNLDFLSQCTSNQDTSKVDYFGVKKIYHTNIDGAQPWFLGKGDWRVRSQLYDGWFDSMTERRPHNELLISWQINPDGSISRLADSGEHAGERAGEISIVSAVRLPNDNKVVTAVSYDGKLKLISWQINPDGSISRLADSGEQSSLADSGEQVGPICLVSAVPLSDNRLVTVVRDRRENLTLMSWHVNSADGTISRLAISGWTGGNISLLSVVSQPENKVVTVVRVFTDVRVITDVDPNPPSDWRNIIRLISWQINTDGSISQLSDSDPQSSKEDFDISQLSTVAQFPNKVVTAFRDSNKNLKLISWQINPDGSISRLV